MRMRVMFGACAWVLPAAAFAAAGGCHADAANPVQSAATSEHAVGSAAAAASANAAAELEAKSATPEAFAAALKELDASANASPAERARLQARASNLGGQRDADASRVFWYRDLAQAKRAAKASGKPILSLRLLGKLTDEFSCANSRFFRSALYPNKIVADMLRDRFILHWSSERPVPVVTIDLGDGHQVKRTVTGNSVHYILDADGGVADALPGLYTPRAFVEALEQARLVANAPVAERAQMHAQAFSKTSAAATSAFIGLPIRLSEASAGLGIAMGAPAFQAQPPGAAAAGTRAMGKSMAEGPMVRGTLPFAMAQPVAPDVQVWSMVAAKAGADPLDAAARASMQRKWLGANGTTVAHQGNTFETVLSNFERSMAADSARNELQLHLRIHQWLAEGPLPEFSALNQRVYSELFLTPKDDPYLGLLTPAQYTGVEGDGALALEAYPKEAFTLDAPAVPAAAQFMGFGQGAALGPSLLPPAQPVRKTPAAPQPNSEKPAASGIKRDRPF